MKAETFASIVKEIGSLSRPGDRATCIAKLRQLYPAYDAQTFGSIYSQEVVKKVKKSYHRHVQNADQYYADFLERTEESAGTEVVLFKMARELDFPPSLLCKMVVERHLLTRKQETEKLGESEAFEITIVTKPELNKALRSPGSLSDHPRLAAEVELCNVLDDDYGPLADVIKQSFGHEKEVWLKRRARELNLVFKDEDQMRAEGFDKTPDLRLEIPVAVDGVVIRWIESKASFGDEGTHNVYLKDQFWSYQNRFGPGIVIYWFGFVEELDVHRSQGILLYDHLPENFVHFDPHKLRPKSNFDDAQTSSP